MFAVYQGVFYKQISVIILLCFFERNVIQFMKNAQTLFAVRAILYLRNFSN